LKVAWHFTKQNLHSTSRSSIASSNQSAICGTAFEASPWQAWRKAVELAPDSYPLRYDLGYMLVRRGRYDLAATEFAHVLEHWPDDIETNFMLGLCYKELMEPARSIPLLEKVLRRNPRHAQALFYLGACYLQIGNTSLGKAYLRRYDHLIRQNQPAPATPRASARRRSSPVMRSTV
jgi:tetratricopeptide (TPR) repeat protein